MRQTMRTCLIALTLMSIPGLASAGCKINLSVQAPGDTNIRVFNWGNSAVKSKGGVWRNLRFGQWISNKIMARSISAGGTFSDVYNASFGCSKKRRYRISYQCGPNREEKAYYYPSTSGWTTKQSLTINLPCAG